MDSGNDIQRSAQLECKLRPRSRAREQPSQAFLGYFNFSQRYERNHSKISSSLFMFMRQSYVWVGRQTYVWETDICLGDIHMLGIRTYVSLTDLHLFRQICFLHRSVWYYSGEYEYETAFVDTLLSPGLYIIN